MTTATKTKVIGVVHLAARTTAAILLVAAAAELLRAAGARGLALGLATVLALLATMAGVTALVLGHVVRHDGLVMGFTLVGLALVGCGATGVVMGLRALGHVVPLDPALVAAAVVAILVTVAPLGIVAVAFARGVAGKA